jgi:hypothetical protein
MVTSPSITVDFYCSSESKAAAPADNTANAPLLSIALRRKKNL